MENLDHIHRIISEAIRSHIDITPADRQEWVMYCCALKVLGYDETTFVALSNCPDKESRKVWRAERNPQRYVKSQEQAAKKIWYFAEAAGMNPKQFLLPQNEYRPTAPRPTPRPMEQHRPAPPCVYITPSQVSAAETHHRETSLFAFLCQYFAPDDISRVFARYHVGASKYINPQGGRAVAFPYINTSAQCVDVKLFHIDPTTGSRKTAPPLSTWIDRDGKQQTKQSSWAIAEMKQSDRRAPWCNFGDHLLQLNPTAPVAIVESEKTALICALTYPEIIWLAVGSKNNLNANRLTPCRYRKITIFPDRDGYNDKPRKDGKGIEKGWRTIAKELTAQGFAISVDTTTESHPGASNDDISDIVLRSMRGEQPPPEAAPTSDTMPPDQAEAVRVWEQMKQDHPHLRELETTLCLTPIRVTRE